MKVGTSGNAHQRFGLATAKTPMDYVRRLNAAVQEALQSPEIQDVLTRNGLVALIEGPEPFAQRLKNELTAWGPVVKATGFTPDD